MSTESTRRARRGSSLIEVVAALTILALGGTGLITLMGQTRQSMMQLETSERETTAAERELDRLGTWSRRDLQSRSGTSYHHGWRLDITPVALGVFDVSIAGSDTTAVLLRTTLYRPDTLDAE